MDTERYVLTCSRYIELNPVRARMVGDPSEYPWSSYQANALGRPDGLVTPSPTLLALAGDPAARATAYRALFNEVLTDEAIAEIRLFLQQQRALGTDRFRAEMEAKLKRFADVRSAHRPRKQARGSTMRLLGSASDTVLPPFSSTTRCCRGCSRPPAFELRAVG